MRQRIWVASKFCFTVSEFTNALGIHTYGLSCRLSIGIATVSGDACCEVSTERICTTSGESSVTVDFGVVTAGKFSAGSIEEGTKIAKDPTDFAGTFAYEISQHRCFEREKKGLAQRVAY